MAAPPQNQMPPPQPYPGMYYMPMTLEGQLSRRNVWFANVLGLGLMWFAFILRLVSADPNVAKFAVFLVISGAVGATLINLAAALASKKTTDMQNVGLLVWSGFVLAFAAAILGPLALF